MLRIEGRGDDMVVLRLLEAHCLPVLTYGLEVIHVKDRDERRQLRVAYNSIYRKVFNYGFTESVTNLQHALGRLTWEELTKERTENFLQRCTVCPSGSLVHKLAS